MAATRKALERVKELMRRFDWARHTLALEVTLPVVALIAAVTVISAAIIGREVTKIHECEAREHVRRFGAALREVYRQQANPGHPDLAPLLRAACAAAEQSAFVADASGRVELACDEALVGTSIDPRLEPGQRISGGGAPFSRWLDPIRAEPKCLGCHPGQGPIALLGIDFPLSEQDSEVEQQRTLNLIAGGVVAAGIALLLVVIQLFFVYRPVRRLTDMVERIRAGDLSVRIPSARKDELGRLASSVNEMAASLEGAKAELARTHRAELAQSEKLAALGKLFSTVAHEIKNQLAGIIGAMKVLEVEYPAGDPNKPVLTKVLSQMERMSRTAVTALDYARPLKPGAAPVDVGALLEQTLFFIERQAAEQKVELRRRYAPELPRARIDEDLMKQVFLNILINGLQAMPSGGTLEVETRASGPRAVEVAISDQGMGIAPEDKERIFSPFFSTKANGTGLGLYIARQIVETQQGQIQVESRLGAGTRFVVRLPAACAHEEGRPHAAG